MLFNTIMKQLITGDDSVYVALSEPDIDSNTYQTLEEAQVKLAEIEAIETENRKYYIYSY